MEAIIIDGDLFINGALITGSNGCMLAEGGITYNISKSIDADEWRDACLECPNIVDGDLCLDGKRVNVWGDVYVWMEAILTPGTTGFISCFSPARNIVLNADKNRI